MNDEKNDKISLDLGKLIVERLKKEAPIEAVDIITILTNTFYNLLMTAPQIGGKKALKACAYTLLELYELESDEGVDEKK